MIYFNELSTEVVFALLQERLKIYIIFWIIPLIKYLYLNKDQVWLYSEFHPLPLTYKAPTLLYQ